MAGSCDPPALQINLGYSLKTVKRELEALRLAGRIEFIGPSKAGTYQLVLNQAYSEREKFEERRKPPAFSGVC
jgi:hypothetical protein